MAESDDDKQGTLARLKADASARWAALQRRRPSVRHVVAAWNRLKDNRGNLHAGAITYFSFLALFPMLLLAVAVTGFVLHSQPDVQQRLLDHITANVPGDLGDTLSKSVRAAIRERTGVGIVGVLGVLFTGLGWIGHLRNAIDAVWERVPDKPNFVVGKAMNLLVLAGLGLGLVISVALTVLGTTLTNQILDWTGLDDVPGAGVVLKVAGLALAVLGDLIIFAWLLIRLPFLDVPISIGFRGALMAAIGFEVLKVVGSFTIARSAQSATAGPFAGLLAVLIWFQLVARFMLFCAAWMATVTFEHAEAEKERAMAAGRRPRPGGISAEEHERAVALARRPEVSPAAVGAGLVGAGAVAGALAMGWVGGRWDALRRTRSARDT